MSYALDINNPRIKQAMENLGIDKDELQIKSPADFGGKNAREEVKHLWFESYSKRLEETVRLIRNSLRSGTARIKDDSLISPTVRSGSECSVKTASGNRKIFLSEKNKDILITALHEIKEEFTMEPQKERPRSMAHPRSLKASRIDQLKKNQQQNLDRIRNDEEVKVRKALSDSFTFARGIHSARGNRDLKSMNNSMKKSINLSASGNNSEIEITNKLEKFENKLEKSRALHEKQINMRREHVKSYIATVSVERPLLPQEEIICRIMKRTSAASERKKEKYLKQREKWEKLKYANEKRVLKIQELEKEYNNHISEKEATLMKKLTAAERIIRNRKESIGKEIELKIELQKIRDEEAYIKMRRAQRIM